MSVCAANIAIPLTYPFGAQPQMYIEHDLIVLLDKNCLQNRSPIVLADYGRQPEYV